MKKKKDQHKINKGQKSEAIDLDHFCLHLYILFFIKFPNLE